MGKILSTNSRHFIRAAEKEFGAVFEYNSETSIDDFPVYTLKKGEIIELRMINIRLKSLKEIPHISTLQKLQYLEVSNNDLTDLHGIETLNHLQFLKVQDNRIRSLKGLNNVSLLRKLDISHNHLTSMKGIGGLRKLEVLDLSHNLISVISRLSNLVNLKHVNLSFNVLKNIQGIESLPNLEYLILNNNTITSIPPSIDCLRKLFRLDIQNNKISTLPQNLLKLHDLMKYNFDKNPLYFPEQEKFRKLKYLVHWNQEENGEFLTNLWNKIRNNRPLTVIDRKSPLFTEFFPNYYSYDCEIYKKWTLNCIIDKLKLNTFPSSLDLHHHLFLSKWRIIEAHLEKNPINNEATRKFLSYLSTRFSIQKDGGFTILL